MLVGIPTQLKEAWNSHLRSLAALIQNHAGSLITGYGKLSKTTIKQIEEQIETARRILTCYHQLFPIYLSQANADWLKDGHECMLKAHMIPPSVREELKEKYGEKQIIFIGLIIDALTIYFIDGSKIEWVEHEPKTWARNYGAN